jgi:hypothetical protein
VAWLASAAVAGHTATVAAGNGRTGVIVAAAACSVALAGVVLARWEAGVVWSVALAAAAYAAALALAGGPTDQAAPLVAAGLVIAAEVGQWAVELARPAAVDRGIVPRRAAFLLLAAAGAVVGSALLLVSHAAAGGIVLTGAGLVAAGAAMVLVTRLARGT